MFHIFSSIIFASIIFAFLEQLHSHTYRGQHDVVVTHTSDQLQPNTQVLPSASCGDSPEGNIPSQIGGTISSQLHKGETVSRKAFALQDKVLNVGVTQ